MRRRIAPEVLAVKREIAAGVPVFHRLVRVGSRFLIEQDIISTFPEWKHWFDDEAAARARFSKLPGIPWHAV